MKIRELAISWILHSIKIILGDEGIRRFIILNKFPSLKHQFKKAIRTFDPFVKKRKTREDKHNEIQKYLDYAIKLDNVVVFTATNVQQNNEDNETHYQSFIVDNARVRLLQTDSARLSNEVIRWEGKAKKRQLWIFLLIGVIGAYFYVKSKL